MVGFNVPSYYTMILLSIYMSGVSVSTLFTNARHLQGKNLTFYLAFLDVAKAHDSDALIGIPPKYYVD